jgi:hypothetical protein
MEGAFGELLLPRDRKAGGTWIAARADGYTLVLLNGAFKPHISKPPYRLSRGAIIPAIMQAQFPEIAFTDFYLENIEPFTLIIAKDNYLEEWRWDGQAKYHNLLNASIAHCWSSVTLYADWQIRFREKWFLSAAELNFMQLPENLMVWHGRKGRGAPDYDIILKRTGGLVTVSTTIVEKLNNKISMRYCDYLSGSRVIHNMAKVLPLVI